MSIEHELARDMVVIAAREMWDALTFGNIHRISHKTQLLGEALNHLLATENREKYSNPKPY